MAAAAVVAAPSSAVDSSPYSHDASMNEAINMIWSQVKARVIQLAGDDPEKIKQNLDIDGVLSHLDQAQDQHAKAAEKYSTIRSTFNSTLQLIQTVGGIVAGGASQVFGPSELCFNAINFVIVAWQGYEGVFESLAGLLEKCMEYLSRLGYYVSGGMDAKLAKVACQHLQLFVEICDRTMKLRRSKRARLMVFTKLFFLNDNDIGDLLSKMSSLVDKEGRLVTAQIFNFSSEAAMNARENLAINKKMDGKIDILIEDRSDRKKETDTQKWRETVLRALHFDDENFDREKNEPKAYWQSTYHNFRKLVVPDTGEWIFSEPRFRAWESGEVGVPRILAIEGVEGSGKSYLTSTVIRHLRNRASAESSDSRTLVAFYFLEGDSKEGSEKINRLDVISKSLVWQFTQADAPYLKSAAGTCEKVEDLDPQEIATKLLFDNKDLKRMDATFTIIIDGLGHTVEDGLVRFLQASAQSQDRDIRVLLTGNPRAFEQLAVAEGMIFETIPINSKNQPDVEKYIDTKMDAMDALKDTTRHGIAELRQKIRQRLCEQTAGDFFKMDTTLSQISMLDSVSDIDQVLEDAGKERSQQILAELEKLNNIRTPKEIAEINEIITWIGFGREWFKPSEMAAVLYVKSGELSLLPLETKLKTRYSLFVIDSDGDINWKSSEIPELIPVKGRPSHDALSSDVAKRIQPAEVNIVRHFLQTVCPPDIYEKFEFEPFFEEKLSLKTDHICRDDKDTAEIKLALTCLRVLTEEMDERRAILRPYAVNYLPVHLMSVDLALVDRDLKSAIGPRLYTLFTDEQSIDKFFWTDDPADLTHFGWSLRASWLHNDNHVHEVLRWLKDSAVISDISDEHAKAWIMDVTSDEQSDNDLLRQSMRRMAVHCFQEPSSPNLTREAFFFLRGFINKLETRKGTTDLRTGDDTHKLTVEQISQVEELAQSLLNVEKKDPLWEVQMAVVLNLFSFANEAEKRCRHALELDPSNLRASQRLASVTSSTEEAIQILKQVTERLQSDGEWMQEVGHMKVLAEMLFDLGQKYWEAGQFEPAVQTYTAAMRKDPNAYERALVILGLYHSKDRWSDVAALLEALREGSSGEKENLSEMLVELAAKENLHDIVLSTAMETDRFELLESMYEGAIESALRSQAYSSLYYVRYYYATALNQRSESEEKAIALWELALKDDLPRSDLDLEVNLPRLTVKLAPIYLRRARAAERDSDVAKGYLDRIAEIHLADAAESWILYPSKLYIARYYHSNGDEVRAKQVARNTVKVALEMLSDDDEGNDLVAFWRLSLAFLPLDDDRNTTTAFTMATLAYRSPYWWGQPKPAEPAPDESEPEDQHDGVLERQGDVESAATVASHENEINKIANEDILTEKSGVKEVGEPVKREAEEDNQEEREEEEKEKEKEEKNGFEEWPFATCDGGCGHIWNSASEMWWCKDCVSLSFEKNCFDKIQNKTLRLNLCDSNHEFLFVPKWDDEKMRQVPKGSVLYGDQIITFEEWKAIIREKYIDFDH